MTSETTNAGPAASDADGGKGDLDARTAGLVPVGAIVAWHKSFSNTPSLPSEFMECNGQQVTDAGSVYYGQTLPDLNGDERFLRGSSSSGTEQSGATARPSTAFQTGYQDASHTHSHDHGSVVSGTQSAGHTHAHTHGNVVSGSQSASHDHLQRLGYTFDDNGPYFDYYHQKSDDLGTAGHCTDVERQDHTHTTYIGAKTSGSQSASHTHAVDLPSCISGSQSASHRHTIDGGGDAETRPVNLSVVWIMRVK